MTVGEGALFLFAWLMINYAFFHWGHTRGKLEQLHESRTSITREDAHAMVTAMERLCDYTETLMEVSTADAVTARPPLTLLRDEPPRV